jgi:ribonuclease Y
MIKDFEKAREIIEYARDGEARLEERARDILVSSIYRIANGQISQFMTSTVEIDNDEIKGKIIGKEGRNIKTFERMSGVEVLVDEIPNGIVVSCFDPVRRAIAVNALQMLIKDGRIQPVKIEECLEKAKKEIGTFMKKKGEEAVLACGLLSIPEELIPIIGRLYFRTSYGQNVLDHSVEMAHIAGVLATELGVDVHVAKAGALLHDIGKAVDHEIQGTHVEIGRKILMKYGVDERVILAMQAHHEEYPYETAESVIVQVADAISGGRPGARRDTVERYIKRLEDLEALAMSFSGIEKVYALQAGREIRIFVSPLLVSDLEARDLARNIALRVEQELRFPGEIKIHVIRESRMIEFAR